MLRRAHNLVHSSSVGLFLSNETSTLSVPRPENMGRLPTETAAAQPYLHQAPEDLDHGVPRVASSKNRLFNGADENQV